MRMDKRRVLASETQLIKWLHEFQAGCFMARNLHVSRIYINVFHIVMHIYILMSRYALIIIGRPTTG